MTIFYDVPGRDWRCGLFSLIYFIAGSISLEVTHLIDKDRKTGVLVGECCSAYLIQKGIQCGSAVDRVT